MAPRSAVQDERQNDLAMLIYRGTDGPSVDDKGRIFGETGESDASAAQRRADSEFCRIAEAKRPRIKLLIVIVRGKVRRIWPVIPTDPWTEEDGKVGLPLGKYPLTPEQVRSRYPALGIAVGDERPRQQGKMREYVPICG